MKKKKVNDKKVNNKKKTIIIVSIVIFVFLILGIGGYLFYDSKKLKVNLVSDRVVNINDEVDNTDYIKSIKNGTIISDKEQVDTSILGKKKIVLKIKNYFNNIEKFTYDIDIVDREEPSIDYNDRLSTTEGVEIDLLGGVKANDNSNEEIEVTIEGEYDFNKVGEYELYYVEREIYFRGYEEKRSGSEYF